MAVPTTIRWTAPRDWGDGSEVYITDIAYYQVIRNGITDPVYAETTATFAEVNVAGTYTIITVDRWGRKSAQSTGILVTDMAFTTAAQTAYILTSGTPTGLYWSTQPTDDDTIMWSSTAPLRVISGLDTMVDNPAGAVTFSDAPGSDGSVAGTTWTLANTNLPGVYSSTIRANDTVDDVDSRAFQTTVSGEQPTASIDDPGVLVWGGDATFALTEGGDTDGGNRFYQWEFDRPFANPGATTSATFVATPLTIADEGISVTCTVKKYTVDNATYTVTTDAYVVGALGVNPTVSISDPGTITEGQDTLITAVPTSSDGNTTFFYQWTNAGNATLLNATEPTVTLQNPTAEGDNGQNLTCTVTAYSADSGYTGFDDLTMVVVEATGSIRQYAPQHDSATNSYGYRTDVFGDLVEDDSGNILRILVDNATVDFAYVYLVENVYDTGTSTVSLTYPDGAGGWLPGANLYYVDKVGARDRWRTTGGRADIVTQLVADSNASSTDPNDFVYVNIDLVLAHGVIAATTSSLYWSATNDSGAVDSSGRLAIGQTLHVGERGVISNSDVNEYLDELNAAPVTAPPLPPEGTPLAANDVYAWGDGNVSVRQDHIRTADDPDTVPALFSVYRADYEGMEWIANEPVLLLDKRAYEGVNYECIQAHTTQADWTPPATPSMWSVFVEGIQPWVQPEGAHDAYQIGDKVTHVGSTWESTHADNVWEPGVFGWVVVEDAPA